jgi:hypothetical protein
MNHQLERIQKETAMAYSIYCPGSDWQRLRKSTETSEQPWLCTESFAVVTILTELSWFSNAATEP